MALQILNRRGESPFWTCWLRFYQGNLACCWPSLQRHIGGACSPHHLSWSPGNFFLELLHTPACTGVWANPLQSARFDLCEVPARPLLQPEQLLQNRNPALQCIGCSSSSSVPPANLCRVALYAVLSQLQQPHTLSRVLPSQRAEGIGLNMMDTA